MTLSELVLPRTLPSPARIRKAEATADKIRKLAQVIDSAAWDLDAALSAIEKDKAGYRRSNAANRDGGANYATGELETAEKAAEGLLELFRMLIHT